MKAVKLGPKEAESKAAGALFSPWLSLAGLSAVCALAFLQVEKTCRLTPLAIDEQVSFFLASGDSAAEVHRRTTTQAATPTLPFWIHHVAWSRLRDAPWIRSPEEAFRFPAPAAWVVSLVAVWMACKPLAGAGGALAAAILLLGAEDAAYQATQARPYIFGLAFTLASAACLIRLRLFGWAIGPAACLVVAQTASLWTHLLFAPTLAGQWIMAFFLRPTASAGSRPTATSMLTLTTLSAISALSLIPLTPMIMRLQANADLLNWITIRPEFLRQFGMFRPLPALACFTLAAALGTVSRLRGWSPRNPPASDFGAAVGLSTWFAAPIVALWAASFVGGASLSQPRYSFVQIGPMCVATAWALSRLSRPSAAVTAAIAFVACDGGFARFVDYRRHPVRHDRYWKDAAEFLNQRSTPGDLVFVQSGLVESALTPAAFRDERFQGYACSRLSDFYFKAGSKRRTLPLRWVDGEWLEEYGRLAKTTLAGGGRIYLVISADSDLGQAIAVEATRWLNRLGLDVDVLRGERVAVVLQARPR